MEYVLLIVVLILLLNLIGKIKSMTNNFSQQIKTLDDKLDKILREQKTIPSASSKTTAKTIPEDQFSKQPSIVTPPLEKPPTIPDQKPAYAAEMYPSQPKPQTNPPIEATRRPSPKPTIIEAKKKIKATRPSLWERFKEKNPDLEKFIGENLINKLGVLILVLGISYFVKYAIDKDWINEPARVGIGILAGSLVLAIAHKLRKKYASFSSVLVAGAIAIFYFTIAIAFHEYQLFSQTVAFVIMILITAFSCLISLSYNRMELAILSLIGGFAVPFMISTGSGNYLVLFSYIAILDIGILALAYFKKWNLVNILAFTFTTLLFGGWVIKEMDLEAPHYLGALVFGFIFYIIFVMTNIINNIRTKGTFSKPQLAILAINTFVFYGIGMLVLSNYHPELQGLFTAILAVLNLVYAWFLYKKFGLDKTAVYLLIGLTLTFITLAIPIQFKGNYITLFWAAEAVLLMWLAQKSQIKSYRFAAVLVQILMLFSLCIDWLNFYMTSDPLSIVFNPIFITGIAAVASLVSVWYLLRNETALLHKFKLVFNPIIYRKVAIITAIVVGYLVGIFEIGYQSMEHLGSETYNTYTLPVLYHLLFTAVLCFFLYRKRTTSGDKLLNIIAIFNILAFAFSFSNLAFLEQKGNIISGQKSQIAFYTHYLSLALVIYFGYLLYATNKKQVVFGIFSNRIAIWAAAFMFVFIANTEVILHGLQIMDPQVSTAQIAANISDGEEVDFSEKWWLVDDAFQLAKFKIIKTGLPVLWGILAFVFLLLGIKKQVKELRIIALTLLGITIVKLFTYDISNVSETGKIIAFILLGVLILIISFVYQKIKVLVIDENKTSENDEINDKVT